MDRSQQPFEVRWTRVYTLPDFVRFAHKPHIHAGIECQRCHGPVQEMDRIVPVHEINMGFCLNCHFEKKARTDLLYLPLLEAGRRHGGRHYKSRLRNGI